MRHEYERKGTFTVYGPGELVLCEVIRSVSWVLPVASTEATISSIFLSELSASCARLIALPSSLRSSTASQGSSHVFQGRAKYRTASPGREGDEPAFQAQLTGFGLYPKNAISYPAGRCRKFVIHVRPQRRADIPSNLPGTCSFHCPAEELSRPGPVRSADPFTPFVADSPFG